MYFYLAMVGFEPTPTSTAAPSNTETTVIPSRPLRSLKKKVGNTTTSHIFIFPRALSVKQHLQEVCKQWRNKDVLLLGDGGARTHADFDCCA